MNYTHFVSVAGLVCNENEEILLIKVHGGVGNIQAEW